MLGSFGLVFLMKTGNDAKCCIFLQCLGSSEKVCSSGNIWRMLRSVLISRQDEWNGWGSLLYFCPSAVAVFSGVATSVCVLFRNVGLNQACKRCLIMFYNDLQYTYKASFLCRKCILNLPCCKNWFIICVNKFTKTKCQSALDTFYKEKVLSPKILLLATSIVGFDWGMLV